MHAAEADADVVAERERKARATAWLREIRADVVAFSAHTEAAVARMSVGELLAAHEKAAPRMMSSRPGRRT